MENTFLSFCVKALFFIVSLFLLLLPLVNNIHDYKRRYEARSSLLNRVDLKGYPYILIGDSVFCSSYVHSENETIWRRFESITGEKLFPGALDGANKLNILSSANYISQKCTNSTVFINISPTRFVKTPFENHNYEREFSDLLEEEDSPLYKYANYFDVDYLHYLPFVRTGKFDFIGYSSWNADGGFARSRYFSFSKMDPLAPDENLSILKQINDVFREKRINAVFVLTPVNKQLIYAYSDASKADRIYHLLKDINAKTLSYMKQIDAPVIDLFEAVPSNCFADLIHTNTCGDEIIANSLASYSFKLRGSTRRDLSK